MNECIPQLSISTLDNGNLRLETDEPMGNHSWVVDVHPIHVRLMAERLGLVATSNVQAARRIKALSRRLRTLNDRCQYLGYYLANCSDHRHADLTYEQQFSEATADIAREYAADLDDEPETPATAPETPTCDVTRDVTVTSPPASAGAQLEIPA